MSYSEVITDLIWRAIAGRIFPGAVVLAASEAHVLHLGAYGMTMYADAGTRPVTTGDIFDIASLTKVVTATVALALVDAGWLCLDDEVARYLPGVAATGVTVRHLLTHSSGLDLRLSVLRERGPAGIRAAVWGVAPSHTPGTRVSYTNINSLLLGEIVSVAAAAPLDAAIRMLVLDPLGMTETGYCPAANLAARIVPTEWDYEWRGGLVHGVVHDESAYALGGIVGHAGLFSTATDLARLLRMWLWGGTWEGRQILREATVAEALRDHTAGLTTPSGSPVRSGLGWMLDRSSVMGRAPEGSFGHTGFTGPAMVGIPELGLAVVVLSNRTYPQRTPPPFRHHAVTAAIVNALLKAAA